MFTLPVYTYSRPPELATGQAALYPVVVVGGGLTGLSLALDLARRGVPVVVLDDDNTVGVRGLASRGMCWAQRTLDIFDRLGVADPIVSKGVTWNVGRVLSGDMPVASFQLQAEGDLRHNGFANLQQYYVEQFLVEALQREPLADLRWLSRVSAVQQAEDHVEIEVQTPDGPYRTRAQWLVACDGAHSGVRQALGLGTRVHDKAEDRWIIIDVVLRNRELPPERWTWLDARANHGRAVWRHKMADNTWRLDFQLRADEAADSALTPARMHQRVSELLGADVEFDVAWTGVWQYRHECMEALRSGRVLFAGDAAHLVAPFGARGGNGGVQDADNLAWKLALHLQGHADAALLDSYSSERIQAAHENIRQARRSSRFVYPQGHASAQLWREAIMALAPSEPAVARFINTGRLSTPCVYAQLGPGAGFALPNVRLRGGAEPRHLHDLLGPWFTALVFDEALAPEWADLGHPLLTVVTVPPLCDATGRAALARQLPQASGVWLLRPDQHVLATALTSPSAALDHLPTETRHAQSTSA